ncbi:MAG: polyphosphate polymerase domain-containing protein [Bacteroidales bacterium]|nr:polyphosphate polymerase domain-containing protein [Bacteroidales bacterium]
MNITDPMEDISPILALFEPISLEEMDRAKLLDRMDLKFIFQRSLLPEILRNCQENYKVLSIKEERFSRYETHYFDTTDFSMYIQHHNGKLNRHKVRYRKYVDSGLCFFEIKFKTNKGRTIKDRVKVKELKSNIEGASEQLLIKKTDFEATALVESLKVNYNRITLVNKNLSERVTIDVSLSYGTQPNCCEYPGIVIAEVKQEKTSRSPMISVMQSHHIHPLSLSKYCLGIASMNQDIKSNNFKPKLLHVKKLSNNQE